MAVVLNSPDRNRSGKLAGLLLMTLLLMLATGCQSSRSASGLQTRDVVIGGETFTLELAMDPDKRFQGLSDRKSLPANHGMLFVFPQPGMLNFVMRKCLFDIDLIYLGPGGRIVSMHQMVMQPYDTPEHELTYYGSGWPAQFAIELAKGSIDRLGLKIGQKIELPLIELKAAAK